MTLRVVVPIVALAAALTWSARPAAGRAQNPLPGTRLSIEELRQQMFHVSAGKRLKPQAWPGGAAVAVALSFDVDNATATLAAGVLDYEVISRGEYGAVDGLPRLLRLLDRHRVPASFFIPAVSAILHPHMIADIQASGRHEIGVHGWIHERLPVLNDPREEQRLLTQSIDHLTKATGRRPVGLPGPVVAVQRLDDAADQGRGVSLRQQPDGERRRLRAAPRRPAHRRRSSCRSSASSTTSRTSAGARTAPTRPWRRSSTCSRPSSTSLTRSAGSTSSPCTRTSWGTAPGWRCSTG